MRKVLTIAAIVLAVVLTVIGVTAFSLYEASHQVPEFYRQAITADPEEQEQARDQFVVQATALASDLNRAGSWQSLFTADQINAWLALELAKSYPDITAGALREPRVSLCDNEATIACRCGEGDQCSVLSLTVDASLHGPNVLALRIRRARAGMLPVPLGQVLDGISQAARQLNLRLEWRKTKGDPVALITLCGPLRPGNSGLALHSIELRQGELFLSGTMIRGDESTPSVPLEEQNPTVRDDSSDDQPRVGSAAKETRHE